VWSSQKEFGGLIHMNGRVADAVTGRFLSADPFVPHPSLTQSYNRYAYVRNNPPSFVDPSGFNDFQSGDGGPNLPEVVVNGQRWNWNVAIVRPDQFDDFWNSRRLEIPRLPESFTLDPEGEDADDAADAQAADKGVEEKSPQGPCAATSAGAGGNGVLIQLAYTDARASGRPIGNQSHAFVLAINPANGQIYAARGGPGSGPGGGNGTRFNGFVAVSGPLNANFSDQLSEVHSVQTVGRVNASFSSVVGYMNAFASVTNSNNLSYMGSFQNSNSYAVTLTEGLGFARPNPAVPALGHSTNRVDPRVGCPRP
jgi:RHS repeat-associated protein